MSTSRKSTVASSTKQQQPRQVYLTGNNDKTTSNTTTTITTTTQRAVGGGGLTFMKAIQGISKDSLQTNHHTLLAKPVSLKGSIDTGFVTSRRKDSGTSAAEGKSSRAAGPAVATTSSSVTGIKRRLGDQDSKPVEIVAKAPKVDKNTLAKAPPSESTSKLRTLIDSLDKNFRKTAAQPALYWLPVPDHVVARRRETLEKSRMQK